MANEHSNIVPNMSPTAKVSDFKFWCQKVLPLVYDDSLSYYEVLNKMVVYLNQVIDNVNADIDNVEELEADFLLLQSYVNNFFDDIDQLVSYAERAEAAETSAIGYAASAAESATNASTSALNAMDAKDAAVTAKNQAQAALTNAQTAATNAAASATAADASATNAAASATSASGYATNASASATAAQNSFTLADAARSAAQTAATNADASATAAAGSATDAASSATAAAASAASADGEKAQEMISESEEESTTAASEHNIGTYFRLNGVLYRATDNIQIGDTISTSTNCEEIHIDEVLTSQSEQIVLETGYRKEGEYTVFENETSPLIVNNVEGKSLISPLTVQIPYTGTQVSEITITQKSSNLCGGDALKTAITTAISSASVNQDKTVSYAASASSNKVFYNNFKEKTPYTFIITLRTSNTNGAPNMILAYTDGTTQNVSCETVNTKQTIIFHSNGNKTLASFRGRNVAGTNYIYYEESGIFEGYIELNDFAQYFNKTTSVTFDGIYGGYVDVLNGYVYEIKDSTGSWKTPTSQKINSNYLFAYKGKNTLQTSAGNIYAGFQIEKNHEYIIDKSGFGNETSFTKFMFEHNNENCSVVVKSGVYDIAAEYIDYFGEDEVASMADSSTEFNNFQFGVYLQNKKITFESGSILQCHWTGTVNGTHRFSALAVARDVELDGMYLDCTGTFYAIHDDYGYSSSPYTNIYKNCTVIASDLVNTCCIGGGVKKFGKIIIDKCYFDNNSSGTCVRYHNNNVGGSVSEIYVSNSYFNYSLAFNQYGSQTDKMRCYVNNCDATSIYVGRETEQSTTENVVLLKWMNDESR